MKKEIKIIKEANGFTAMLSGRLLKDKRHTSVQFFAKTEKTARNQLKKWIKNNSKLWKK